MSFAEYLIKSGKLDPKANVRNRGKVIFPAESKNVKDKKDHFPINSAAQARNALARANQFNKAPEWYKGSLQSFVSTVARAVKKEYPSIEVSKESKKPGPAKKKAYNLVDMALKIKNANFDSEKYYKELDEALTTTSIDRLKDLAQSEYSDIVSYVIMNRNATEDILKPLLNHFSPAVREALAKKENLSENFYMQMALREKNKFVLFALIENKTVPKKVLLNIAENKIYSSLDPDVVDYAKKVLESRKNESRGLDREKIKMILDKKPWNEEVKKYIHKLIVLDTKNEKLRNSLIQKALQEASKYTNPKVEDIKPTIEKEIKKLQLKKYEDFYEKMTNEEILQDLYSGEAGTQYFQQIASKSKIKELFNKYSSWGDEGLLEGEEEHHDPEWRRKNIQRIRQRELGKDIGEDFYEAGQFTPGVESPSLWEEEEDEDLGGELDFPKRSFQTGQSTFRPPVEFKNKLWQEINKLMERSRFSLNDYLPGSDSTTFTELGDLLHNCSWKNYLTNNKYQDMVMDIIGSCNQSKKEVSEARDASRNLDELRDDLVKLSTKLVATDSNKKEMAIKNKALEITKFIEEQFDVVKENVSKCVIESLKSAKTKEIEASYKNYRNITAQAENELEILIEYYNDLEKKQEYNIDVGDLEVDIYTYVMGNDAVGDAHDIIDQISRMGPEASEELRNRLMKKIKYKIKNIKNTKKYMRSEDNL